jgi:hypothetical protein
MLAGVERREDVACAVSWVECVQMLQGAGLGRWDEWCVVGSTNNLCCLVVCAWMLGWFNHKRLWQLGEVQAALCVCG